MHRTFSLASQVGNIWTPPSCYMHLDNLWALCLVFHQYRSTMTHASFQVMWILHIVQITRKLIRWSPVLSKCIYHIFTLDILVGLCQLSTSSCHWHAHIKLRCYLFACFPKILNWKTHMFEDKEVDSWAISHSNLQLWRPSCCEVV